MMLILWQRGSAVTWIKNLEMWNFDDDFKGFVRDYLSKMSHNGYNIITLVHYAFEYTRVVYTMYSTEGGSFSF